ncbi:hypothetical protein P7C73_g5561, partial [Tremellales sp. Uapishka_1]
MSVIVPPVISLSPTRKLRPCLSPVRMSRSTSTDSSSPTSTSRSCSISSTSSSVYTYVENGGWMKRAKNVRWEGEHEGCAVTVGPPLLHIYPESSLIAQSQSYFATYSATEYDRTPLAPPSDAERACALPARGSRCLSSPLDDGDDFGTCPLESGSETETLLDTPPSESETGLEDPEDEEWAACVERRRMMFARMAPLLSCDGPEFEGYRSISANLVQMLRSVGMEDGEDGHSYMGEGENGEEGELVTPSSESGEAEGGDERVGVPKIVVVMDDVEETRSEVEREKERKRSLRIF